MEVESNSVTLKVKWGKTTHEIETDLNSNLESFRT